MARTPAMLARRAEFEPDRVCLVEAETSRSVGYGELYADSLRVARRLADLGVLPGRTVATMLPHSADTYRIWFALGALGALEVPIGTRYRGRMLGHILTDSEAEILVVDAEHLPVLTDVIREHGAASLRTVVVRGEQPPAGPLDVLELLDLDDLRAPSPEPDALWTPYLSQASDIAMVLYTSGTTGPSKGVLVPWGQVHATATGAFPPGTLADDAVIYGPFPPNHIGGRLFVCLGIDAGVPTVTRHVFSASSFWEDVDRYRCTAAGLVSAMASILLTAAPSDDDATHPLRDVLMVPLMAEHEEFTTRFGVRLCTSFNMTEVSIPITSDWGVEDWYSCGTLRAGHPGYEVRVVDEHDYPLGPGQVGELVCRTEAPWALNAGYYRRPAETAKAWRNGWFHTGDAFRVDEAGRFYFVDRVKDAIRRRGENVSSFEVEREVLDHPDVLACAAIGVPAQLGEEEIKVFVVRAPGATLTEQDLVAHVAAKTASFMVPRFVEFLDELPVTEGTNRIKKAELRERSRR